MFHLIFPGDPGAFAPIDHVTVTNPTGSPQVNVPIETGLPLAPSMLLPGQTIQLRQGGSVIANAAIENAMQDLSTSIRGAKLSAIIPSLAPGTTVFDFGRIAGAAQTGSDIAALDMAAIKHDVRLTIVESGTTYTASTNAIFAGGNMAFGKTVKTIKGYHQKGTGIGTCFVLSMPFVTGGGTPHNSGDGLRAEFHVYCYKAQRGAVSGGNPIIFVKAWYKICSGWLEQASGNVSDYLYSLLVEQSTDLSAGTPAVYATVNQPINGTPENWPNTLNVADTLTLGGLSGDLVTATLGGATSWTANINGAVIDDGTGRAQICARLSATQVKLRITKPFAASPLGSGSWSIYGCYHWYGCIYANHCDSGQFSYDICLGSETSATNPTLGATQAYLAATRMYQNFDIPIGAITHSTTALDACVRPFAITTPGGASAYAIGEMTHDMQPSGNRPDIGPEASWTVEGVAKYDASGKRRIFENALKHAQGWQLHHYLSNLTGTLKPFNNGTDYVVDGRFGTHIVYPDRAVANPTHPIMIIDVSHEPQAGFVAWLLTGDFVYLEELHYHQWFQWAGMNPGYHGTQMLRSAGGLVPNRNGTGGPVTSIGAGPYYFADNQMRGFAWMTNYMFKACAATPESVDAAVITLNKAHLKSFVATAGLAAKRCSVDNVDAGGFIYTAGGIRYTHGTGGGSAPFGTNCYSPYMLYYFVWGSYQGKELGLFDANWQATFSFLAPGVTSLYADPGVVPDYISGAYVVTFSQLDGVTLVKTAADAYAYSSAAEILAGNNDTPYNGRRLAGSGAQSVALSALSGSGITVTLPAAKFGNGSTWYSQFNPLGGWIEQLDVSGARIGRGLITSISATHSSDHQLTVDTTVTNGIAFTASPIAANLLQLPPPAPADKLPDGTDNVLRDTNYMQLFHLAASLMAQEGFADAAAARDYMAGAVNYPATQQTKYHFSQR